MTAIARCAAARVSCVCVRSAKGQVLLLLEQSHHELQASADVDAAVRAMSATALLEVIQWEFARLPLIHNAPLEDAARTTHTHTPRNTTRNTRATHAQHTRSLAHASRLPPTRPPSSSSALRRT